MDLKLVQAPKLPLREECCEKPTAKMGCYHHLYSFQVTNLFSRQMPHSNILHFWRRNPHVKHKRAHVSVRPRCDACAQTTAGCVPQGSTLCQ